MMGLGFDRVLQEHGQAAEITLNIGEMEIRAMIQPMMGQKYVSTWDEQTSLGLTDRRRYLCFGMLEEGVHLPRVPVVRCEGREYEVLRLEEYRVEGKVSHFEAVLQPGKEESLV